MFVLSISAYVVNLSFNTSYHWCRMHVLRKAYSLFFEKRSRDLIVHDPVHDPVKNLEFFVPTDMNYFLDLKTLKTEFECGSKVTIHFDTECHRKMYFYGKWPVLTFKKFIRLNLKIYTWWLIGDESAKAQESMRHRNNILASHGS